MKVVYMGTPEFAVPCLKALIDKHEVMAVISQPDKPKGRGKKLLPTPVKEEALKHNIPVYQPEKIKDEAFIEQLSKIDADIFVVAAYGQILPEAILNMPRYGCINVHGSLLPKYRGAAPMQQAVIDGEEVTGITIMYMEKGLDTGDMLLKCEIPITPEDTYGSLHDKMSEAGAKLLLEALDKIEKGEITPEKQDDSKATYAHRIEKSMGHIDWSKSSKEIINLIRGLNPAPGAYTFYNEEMIKLWKAVEVNENYSGTPGEIADINPKKGFTVKTGDSAVLICEMQAKGGKKMSSSDYLRGHAMEKGIILN